MTNSNEPEIADLLETLYVSPSPDFWTNVESDLNAEAKRMLRRNRSGLRTIGPDVVVVMDGSAADGDAGDLLIPAPIPLDERRAQRGWWQSPRLLAAAAAALIIVVGLLGAAIAFRPDGGETIVAEQPDGTTVPSTSVADTAGPDTAGPDTAGPDTAGPEATDAPSSVASTTISPTTAPVAIDAVEGRFNVATGDTGSSIGLDFSTAGPGAIFIPSAHADDVAGQPLLTNIVSDGSGGFIYGLIDFDDNRSDRSSQLLHVAAGAIAPRVLTTEPQLGIGFVAGVVDTDRGPAVVYTTLLEEVTTLVPLSPPSQPVPLSTAHAVAAAGDVIILANDDQCRSFTPVSPSGDVLADFETGHSTDACIERPTPVFEVALSPDGLRLAWVAEDTRTLEVVELQTGASIASTSLAGTTNHIVDIDNRGVVILQPSESVQEVYISFDGIATPLPDPATAFTTVDFDSYSINPALVLSLS